MLIVFRTEINVGGQKTFAYTSDEVDNNGKPINYLNNTQLAELIGLDESKQVWAMILILDKEKLKLVKTTISRFLSGISILVLNT